MQAGAGKYQAHRLRVINMGAYSTKWSVLVVLCEINAVRLFIFHFTAILFRVTEVKNTQMCFGK